MKFLMIIIFAFAINCFPQLPSTTKSTARQDNITLLYVYCFAMYNAWTEVTTVTDNKDGTVRILVEGVNPCGGRKLVSDVLLKKCIQGQVFRSAQNDCKGTGTSTDYYGAQKFQFCPTNDGACETSGDVDVNKSPAASSCDKDITANRKFKIFHPYLIKQSSITDFIKRDEIPNSPFWIDYSPSESTAGAVYLIDIGTRLRFDKKSFQYLLCYHFLGGQS